MLLTIIYRDEHFIAINKPSGLLVHRSFVDPHETQFAMQLLRDQIGQHVFPVHRLDRPTSGVLLFALSADAARAIGPEFSEHRIEKTYIALVRGYLTSEINLDYPLTEEQDDYTDKKAKAAEPKPAVTNFFPLATIDVLYSVDKYPTTRYSLVKCQPKTGRKHQIRRHLKHLNHPIIGDAKHGKGIHNRFFAEKFGGNRLMLACTEMKFTQPFTCEQIQLCAPLDECFFRVLEQFNWVSQIPRPWLLDEYQNAP